MKNTAIDDIFTLVAAGAIGGSVVAAAPYVIDAVKEKTAQVMSTAREILPPLPKNDHLTP
jgi:hypothetical protein